VGSSSCHQFFWIVKCHPAVNDFKLIKTFCFELLISHTSRSISSTQYLPKKNRMLQNAKELLHYSLVLFFLMQDPYSIDIGRFFTGYGI
jgi:hypothetical protein